MEKQRVIVTFHTQSGNEIHREEMSADDGVRSLGEGVEMFVALLTGAVPFINRQREMAGVRFTVNWLLKKP